MIAPAATGSRPLTTSNPAIAISVAMVPYTNDSTHFARSCAASPRASGSSPSGPITGPSEGRRRPWRPARPAGEGAVAGDARPGDSPHAAEVGKRADGVAECGTEPRFLEGIEPVLPPQPDDPEHARLSVVPRLDAPDQPVAEQDRQHVVAPASLGLGDVDLPDVVEVPQSAEQLAVPDEGIERGQEGDPRRHATRRLCCGELAARLLESAEVVADHEPEPADPVDLDGDRGCRPR